MPCVIGANPNALVRAIRWAVLTAATTFVVLLAPVVAVIVAVGRSPTNHHVILVTSIGAVIVGGSVGARVHRHLARPSQRQAT